MAKHTQDLVPDATGVFNEWNAARDAAPEGQLRRIDAGFAQRAGLPVLAALHHLAERLESMPRDRLIAPAEIMAELHLIISVAVGEANLRAQRAGLSTSVPGVPTVPKGGIL